jgi:hypothetical protein
MNKCNREHKKGLILLIIVEQASHEKDIFKYVCEVNIPWLGQAAIVP